MGKAPAHLDDVVGRVVRTGGEKLGHPLGGDAGDDLHLHPVLLLEGLHERLLHHVRPAAAVAGDHEGRGLSIRVGQRDEGAGQDGEDDEQRRAETRCSNHKGEWGVASAVLTKLRE